MDAPDPTLPDAIAGALAEAGVGVAVVRGGRVAFTSGPIRALGDDAALLALADRAAQAPARALGPDGRAFEVRVHRQGAGEGESLVLVARDVEDRELVERRLARSDEILGLGAHALRNPIHVIGMINHLLETRASRGEPADRGTLDRLRRQHERLRRLINELLDLARVQDGRLTVDLVDADLAPIVREATAAAAGRRASDLQVDLVERAPVRADRQERLAEVVHQLVNNAVRFTDAGTPIRVRLRDAGDAWELSVADEGPGVRPEHRASLFGRDAHPDRRRDPQSLGVGLYIAARVVDLHHGTLRFEPTVPTGATFLVTLPKVPPPPPPPPDEVA